MYRILWLCLALIIAGCNKSDTKNSAETISILEWSSTPNPIHAGDKVKLKWRTVGANAVSIDGVAQELAAQGEIDVPVSLTRPFQLIASRSTNGTALETQSASLTVDVIQQAEKEISHPILFVTQPPLAQDKFGRLSAFANHLSDPVSVPRGGDLMLRYPDGSLRSLTAENGYGNSGLQGKNAIAVREPAVHWSGEKAVFSMLVGAPTQGESSSSAQQQARWQLYQVSGLDPLAQSQPKAGKASKIRIEKIAGQDPLYNNLSPIYASDGSILFTSDRPRNGAAHLYPQLDEYEATPSVTGIWRLAADGSLQLLNHTPSGAFTPIIDSFGRVLFTRWDHLQQDQLANRDRDAQFNQVTLPFRSFNYSSEARDAKALNTREEFFPESRVGQDSAYGPVNPYRSNFFTIWQMNQDGSSEETLNHFGLHELVFGYLTPSFANDPALKRETNLQLHRNQFSIRREGGLFHLREDPLQAGLYYAVNARESGSFSTDTIVKFQANPGVNPEHIQITPVTAPVRSDKLPEGRYRNPLPLADGRLLASHSSIQLPPELEQSLPDLRLRFLTYDDKKNYVVPSTYATKGIQKKLSWWDGKRLQNFSGIMWELDAVEVRARPVPQRASTPLEAPERHILQQENIDEQALRRWLAANQLALIITRDQTSRDQADLQQPFNLEVPGGKKTIASHSTQAKTYSISAFQIVEAQQIRAYPDRAGRRHLAQVVSDFSVLNQAVAKIPSSVQIAKDGSTAAFVPAGRALSWQTTDAQGNPVVRERNWVTFQAGEIRTCAACHGINTKNQAGFAPPLQSPEALRELLRKWKIANKSH